MRRISVVFLVAGFAASLYAVDRGELDNRLEKLRTKFELLQSKPDKRIPADVLRRASGIVMLERFQVGVGVGYEGGTGVAMVRTASGQWSAPVFVNANQGSVGAQLGGRASFTVALLMNTNEIYRLGQSAFDFAGMASVTAGNASSKAQATISSSAPEPIVVYNDREGAYAGADVKAGKITASAKDDLAYYGQGLLPKQILFDNAVKPQGAASELIQTLDVSAGERTR